MNPSNSSPRRRRNLALGAEALESRELLTGGAGNTFAIIPGTISTANGTTAIKFTIDPAHFTIPKGAVTLGIDVIPAAGSTVNPLISSVDDPHGNLIPQTFHSIYNPHLLPQQVAAGKGTSAVLTPLRISRSSPNAPLTYTVNITAFNKTSGGFLVGFYLPGDANGDGAVNKADIPVVKAAMNAKSSAQNYNFDADVNRDGRIGKIDLAYTQQNQGVSTTITPVVSANIDPASVDSSGGNNAVGPTVHYTGTATPGATLSFTDSSGLPTVTTTADSLGNYSIVVPLSTGVNTFTVSSSDAFGQTISGTISPVTYVPAPVTAASLGINSSTTSS